MAATEVFSLSNDFRQAASVGICTAASYDWAKKTMIYGEVNQRSQLLPEHVLNAQMSVIRRLDHDLREQADRFNLVVDEERSVSSIDDVIAFAKERNGVVVFWNHHHTMGYRYAHHCKEFFDMECGLYRAKKTADIKKRMQDQFASANYAEVSGAVKLRRN